MSTMSNVARKRIVPEARYEIGTVVLVDEHEIAVETPRGERRALRAASCLVAPAAGDEVALLVSGDGRAFVIAVLDQPNHAGVEISVEGDLRISARGGSCSITSKELNLEATAGNVVLSKLTLLAGEIVAHSRSAHVVVKAIDAFCERLSQTAKRCYRTVEEIDVLRARHADYRTEKEMSLRSEHFLVDARKLVKVDGQELHLG